MSAIGFSFDRQDGSHEQWVNEDTRMTVTVDNGMDEYSIDIMKSMIRQSGVERVAFYCATKKTAKKIGR